MTDAAAWKALSAAERRTRAAGVVERAEVRSIEALGKARDFLAERGENAAVAALLERRLATDPNCAWAHGLRGESNASAVADACLKECELAEEQGGPAVAALRKFRSTEGRPMWVDAAKTKEVADLAAVVRKEEARLSNPYEAAVAKWVHWQRGYQVMRDRAEVHATTGPYLVFVAYEGGKGGAAAADAEIKARNLLARDVAVLAELHDNWTREVAAPLHLTTYGPENADERTLLKVAVFQDPSDFWSYKWEANYWNSDFRVFDGANYVDSEPRFLAAAEALPDDRGAVSAIAALRVEAVKQLLHFHTWDATRKARGRELDWPQCENRMLWSAEGFPRFFGRRLAGTAKTGGPPPSRPWVLESFVGEGVADAKRWKRWLLQEIVSFKDAAELGAAARRRAGGPKGAEPLTELFHGRASGLVDFLWNAEEGGRPKWRGRYLGWLGTEMVAKTRIDPLKGQEVCVRPGFEDFKRAFGLSDTASVAAFEKEWDAFEAGLVEAEKAPDWGERLAAALAAVDK